jgi:hypothetical protein
MVAIPVASLVSSLREVRSLAALHGASPLLLDAILKPFCPTAGTAPNHSSSGTGGGLVPAGIVTAAAAAPPQETATAATGESQCGVIGRAMEALKVGPSFGSYLASAFNPSQQAAILAAALAAASTSRQGVPGVPGGSCSSDKGSVFTLIKGPPGTGKTTTLKGLLNALHLAAYSQFYDGVVAQELAKARATLDDLDAAKRKATQRQPKTGGGATLVETMPPVAALPPPSSGFGGWDSDRGVRKPRLLVAAPSNIAVDNILAKVLAEGFVDGQGRRYNPRIVRVGRGQGSGVKEVSMDVLVEAIGTRDER